MLVKILLGVAVILVLFLGYVALKPNDFRIARSTTIAATPATVFSHVNDLHQWDAWSPYAHLDPTMTKSFNEIPAGPGAHYSWNGNGEVGAGSMTIASTEPPEKIDIKLVFSRPFACQNDVEFTFHPVGEQTEVTWSMTGKATYFYKLMDVFIGMDRMVGGQFAEGLANLKKVVETPPPAAPVKVTRTMSLLENVKPVDSAPEIHIERILQAPRELVFKAWTDPVHLPRWYAPTGCRIEFKRLEVRPGGVFHSCIHTPDGKACWCRGEYLEIVAPERIVYRMESSDETGQPVAPATVGMNPAWPQQTLVTVLFADHGGATKLTLQHTVSEALAKETGAYPSWLNMLDRLAELLPQL